MSKSKYRNPDFKSFLRTSAKNEQKRTSVMEIVEESRVCDYLACYTEDVNHILQRTGEPIVLGLEFDDINKDHYRLAVLILSGQI